LLERKQNKAGTKDKIQEEFRNKESGHTWNWEIQRRHG